METETELERTESRQSPHPYVFIPSDRQSINVYSNSLPSSVKVMFSLGGPYPAEVLALIEMLYGMYVPAQKSNQCNATDNWWSACVLLYISLQLHNHVPPLNVTVLLSCYFTWLP